MIKQQEFDPRIAIAVLDWDVAALTAYSVGILKGKRCVEKKYIRKTASRISADANARETVTIPHNLRDTYPSGKDALQG